MSIVNRNSWHKAAAVAVGLWSITATAGEIPLTRRAHMDAATQKLYDRIRATDGWLLGVGSLSETAATAQEVPATNTPAIIARWRSLYGRHTPVCCEWEMGGGDQPGFKRDWTEAKLFDTLGGVPWFRAHLMNFAIPHGPKKKGSSWDTTTRLEPVLPGGQKHAEFNTFFTQFAREFKSFGRPCVFRPFHEMNGSWFWWGKEPENYRKVWRQVFDLFQREEVHNVIWCWSPSGQTTNAPAFYPGDDLVDIMATDQYFDGPVLMDKARNTLAELARIGLDKPMFLGEMGPLARADYWRGAAGEYAELPRLRGLLVWFARGWDAWDRKKLDPTRGSLIDATSPPEVRAAFQEFLKQPRTVTLERWTAK